jgi:hypothetical protein
LGAAYTTILANHDPRMSTRVMPFAIADELLVVDHAKSARQARAIEDGQLPGYQDVLKLFPLPQLARRIFGTLENGRIDRRLRRQYRGLARDLDFIREHLRRSRPRITELPASLLPFELLFQVTLLGGALDDSRQFYGQVVSELETVITNYLAEPHASVADTILATDRVYELFRTVVPTDDSVQQIDVPDEESQEEDSGVTERLKQNQTRRMPQRKDARELFNAWNDPSREGEPDELAGAEAWSEAETPEQALAEGDVAYNYDEWDRELTDHRLGWCRVVEKRVQHGDRAFVDQTRERHKGVISIRHQFQLMKPENPDAGG